MQAGCVTALVVAGALTVGTGPASAHDKAFKSRVTLKVVNGFTWKGRVSSESPRCVANRKVKLFTGSGKLVGQDFTDEDGRWSYSVLGETYYAKVTRDIRGGSGHRHLCKPDRSPTKSAPPKP
jgi:hypothetical protein